MVSQTLGLRLRDTEGLPAEAVPTNYCSATALAHQEEADSQSDWQTHATLPTLPELGHEVVHTQDQQVPRGFPPRAGLGGIQLEIVDD